MIYSPPPDTDPDILYDDDYIIVVNKPAGLLSVPGRGPEKADCQVTRLQRHHQTVLTVHRLDMETSGLMVFARDPDTHRFLSQAFQNREVEKHYTAWISGIPDTSEGSIDLPLIADWPNRPRQKVDTAVGKPSLTHWTVTRRAKDKCQVSLIPVTGRSHQLRVHMMAMGHPILGDPLYAPPADLAAADRLMLHARFLKLPCLSGNGFQEFVCPAPF
ncbi:MAG: RluA family pseudouridine synthase [Sneathiella sp.]